MEDKGEAEEVSEVGRGRKKSREGAKRKGPLTMMTMTGPDNFQKENLHPKMGD